MQRGSKNVAVTQNIDIGLNEGNALLVQIKGNTFTGTVDFQGTIDGATYENIPYYDRNSLPIALSVAQLSNPGAAQTYVIIPNVSAWDDILAEHLTAEYRVKTEGRGRTVDEWKLRVDGLDNHWLDCLVGCAVAASMQGATLFGTDVKQPPRKRIRLSDLQRTR